MRASVALLMNKLEDQTVFIIGGGPSAKLVDFSLLQNKVVICINDSFIDFPNATMIYWVDDSWAAENSDKLQKHPCKLRFTSKPSQHINYAKTSDPKTQCDGYVLKRTGDFGYNPSPDCLMGNNSGVQVLNLVVNMKPKNVVLIGYDMRTVNRKSHYHNKPRLPISDNIYTDLFIPSMKALYKGMVKYGCTVNVVNATPGSAIQCFPFVDYKDYL
jgi:hypothetical protein